MFAMTQHNIAVADLQYILIMSCIPHIYHVQTRASSGSTSIEFALSVFVLWDMIFIIRGEDFLSLRFIKMQKNV